VPETVVIENLIRRYEQVEGEATREAGVVVMDQLFSRYRATGRFKPLTDRSILCYATEPVALEIERKVIGTLVLFGRCGNILRDCTLTRFHEEQVVRAVYLTELNDIINTKPLPYSHDFFGSQLCRFCSLDMSEMTIAQRMYHKTVLCPLNPILRFQCTLCPLRFEKKDRLDIHLGEHAKKDIRMTRNSNYVCGVYGMSFDHKTTRDRHELTHNPDRPLYYCSLCNKSFTTPYKRNIHENNRTCQHSPKKKASQSIPKCK
jgi:hypothetical protein